MRKFYFLTVLLVLSAAFFGATDVSAQKKTTKKKASTAQLKTSAAKIDWSGTWTVPSRYAASDLKIKKVSATKFEFELEAINGANAGVIDGQATVKGAKAFYDDRTSVDSDSHKQGCRLTFTHNVDHISVEETSECSYYAGNAVVFGEKYYKSVMQARETDFVYLEVFPDKKFDASFKELVESDYEKFLDQFHLVSETENLDEFGAKVFSGCVRGVCISNAAVIMYDETGRFWAAIVYPDYGQEVSINYYSNAEGWKDKMPKTIDAWVMDKKSGNENVTIYYKNKETGN